ncbi:hypothetical protein [Hyphomonas sp.]|uniref:hypothetical protein n=1 Tax=Hyphomonas sp. TaxID=87 RepID=UPI00391DF001
MTVKVRNIIVFGAAALALGACATSSYTTLPGFSELEARNYDCSQLTREYISVRMVQRQVSEASVISVRRIVSGPSDLGLGNLMARADAKDAAGDRLEQIRLTMAAKGCPAVIEAEDEEAEPGRLSMVDRLTENPVMRSANRLVRGN